MSFLSLSLSFHTDTQGRECTPSLGRAEGGKGARCVVDDGDDGFLFSLILSYVCLFCVFFLFLFFEALLCTLCVGKGAVATHACSVACAQHVRM